MPMLKKFFQAIRPKGPTPLPDPDVELALGALMVRVAQSDREYQLEGNQPDRPHSGAAVST